MSEQPTGPITAGTAVLAATALVGGWGIGHVIGQGAKGEDLFATDAPGETTDATEFTTLIGLFAGAGVTWKVSKELADEYGWQKLGLYSAAFVAFVAVGRAIRSRV